MLERAKANTNDTAIEYRRSAIEDIDFPDGYFDVVISSLALHYVREFDVVCQRVSHWLTMGGAFVFSVEHPVFTAVADQQWYQGPTGERLHWLLIITSRNARVARSGWTTTCLNITERRLRT